MEKCSNPECSKDDPECPCPSAHFCIMCKQKDQFYYDIAAAAMPTCDYKISDPTTYIECTLKKIGEFPCIQWYYRCLTCFPSQERENRAEGFCLYCSKECIAKNHNIELGYGPFICNKELSRSFTNCKCANPECNRIVINESLSGLPHFCPYCKALTIEDHGRVFFTEGGNPVLLATYDDELLDCSYNVKGEKFYFQWWYNCEECFEDISEGVCIYCAKKCKRERHTLRLRYGAFFCDKYGKYVEPEPEEEDIIMI